MIKKESDDAKKLGVHLDPLSSLEVNFLRNLIEEFLEVLCWRISCFFFFMVGGGLVFNDFAAINCQFFMLLRCLIIRFLPRRILSVKMMNLMLLVFSIKLMMLLFCTVKGLWSFSLIY